MADELNLPPVINDDGDISSAALKHPKLAASISPTQQCSTDQSSELNIQGDFQGRKYILKLYVVAESVN